MDIINPMKEFNYYFRKEYEAGRGDLVLHTATLDITCHKIYIEFVSSVIKGMLADSEPDAHETGTIIAPLPCDGVAVKHWVDYLYGILPVTTTAAVDILRISDFLAGKDPYEDIKGLLMNAPLAPIVEYSDIPLVTSAIFKIMTSHVSNNRWVEIARPRIRDYSIARDICVQFGMAKPDLVKLDRAIVGGTLCSNLNIKWYTNLVVEMSRWDTLSELEADPPACAKHTRPQLSIPTTWELTIRLANDEKMKAKTAADLSKES